MHEQPKWPNTENAIKHWTVTDIKKIIIIFHKGLKSLVNNKELAKLQYSQKNFLEYETKIYLSICNS